MHLHSLLKVKNAVFAAIAKKVREKLKIPTSIDLEFPTRYPRRNIEKINYEEEVIESNQMVGDIINIFTLSEKSHLFCLDHPKKMTDMHFLQLNLTKALCP